MHTAHLHLNLTGMVPLGYVHMVAFLLVQGKWCHTTTKQIHRS